MQRPLPESLPLTPGVYLYKDAQGRILYVGKARVLRRRVLSYFREEGLPAKTVAMLRHAVRVETLSTTTEKEALLLEASLIKKHRPHYNIVLRDDKQYVLFKLSARHPFPRLEIVRAAKRDGGRYFGPFTSALAARETWKLIHKAFPLRRCSDKALLNRVRPCLYHHMGQCPAPCMQLVSAEDYNLGVRKVADLLSGRSGELLHQLQADMLSASENLEFERAALLRDQIQAVRRTVEKQAAVLPGGGDRDVIGLHKAEKGLALGILFVRGGTLIDGRTFFWPGLDFEDAPELLLSFLAQFYGPVTPPPRVILPWLPGGDEQEAEQGEPAAPAPDESAAPPAPNGQAEQDGLEAAQDERNMLAALEQSLSDMRGGPVRIAVPRSAEENSLVDMAAANARQEALRRRENPLDEKLAAALHLSAPPERIECVDVSHTGGRQTRVGLVVFEKGQPRKQDWRNYAMPDSDDDYATLAAWVPRRLQSGPPWPDLLLIDGGKGQLATVGRALQEAGQGGLFALAAITKARDEAGHTDRRAGNVADRIFLPGRANPLPLREGAPELLFLQLIRDHTHRFALGRHRKARGKAALSGELLRLPGIGPATARLLWQHFGSTENMVKASQTDLEQLPGIGQAKAAALWQKLQGLGK